MNKRYLRLFIGVLLIILGICLLVHNLKGDNEPMKPDRPTVNLTNNFDFKIINEVKQYNDNYMISPLSIAYALDMLKQGANDNTRKQIEDVLENYDLPKTVNIKDRVSIANLLFVNEKNKKDINEAYIKMLQKEYSSDLMFDKLQTPEKVNEWISRKTFEMIPDAIKVMDPNTVLGLANAIAIDVKWKNTLECDSTRERDFTLSDKTKMKTPMMSGSNDVVYIESKNAKGIIKDYMNYDITTGKETYEQNENTISLEYIAILPNGDLDDYLKTFGKEELELLLSNKKSSNAKLDINYNLPKYTYDFDYDKVKQSLYNLGITDAFDPVNARFKNMVNDDSELNLYVNEVLHKSHIEVNENGTKAAAVTVIMLRDGMAIMDEDIKVINITFDKPFLYIIKEKNKDNIWFYGTVYKPMDFKDNPKCEVSYE